MLLELNIRNYTLIENICLNFDEGFNVITGETGVGKSIIIGALSMCMGSRVSKDLIRKGNNKMVVQASFSIDEMNETLIKYLNNIGIDKQDIDDNIILTREVYKTGKNISRINGHVVNVSILRKISSFMIDIHSQHENQSLLLKDNHIEVIDNFGNESINSLKNDINDLYNEYKKNEKEYIDIKENEMKLEREKDLLDFQLNEISSANIVEGDDVVLENQSKILNNSETIFTNVNRIYELLYNDDKAIYDNISKCISWLEEISEIDEKLKIQLSQLNNVLALIEDCTFFLRDYKENIEFNSDELNSIESKINLINNLKRKYGPEITDIIKYKEYIIEKLQKIKNKDKILIEIENKINDLKNKYINKSKKISIERQKISKLFQIEITKNLHELAMNNATFKVIIKTNESNFKYNGIDDIEFFIQTNKGTDFKPIIKIASGGELSRIMLSIKSAIAYSDEIETLIYDEIDTGISGRTAQVVAEKMKKLSNSHQIICITHLPQIASMADLHYNITKIEKNGETYTEFNKLNNEKRYIEIAKMLSGAEITQKSIDNAKEMIELVGKIE